MTSHVKLGDSKHGGALFLLPREIRDEIYRLLVKGSYLDTGCFYRCSRKDRYPPTDIRPDFAILRVSKSIGREATEILYSESVFRFIITTGFYGEHILSPDLDRMKRLAPTIQNVILDVGSFNEPDVFYEINMPVAVQSFGGLDVTRRSLLVRMLSCAKFWSKGRELPRVCQQLKAFVGFRAATLEVVPARWLLSTLPINSSPDAAKNARKIRKIVAQTAQTVAEELEPILGPAASGFRISAGNVPIPDFKLSRLRNTSLIGYLEFPSNKNLVEDQVAKENQVQ